MTRKPVVRAKPAPAATDQPQAEHRSTEPNRNKHPAPGRPTDAAEQPAAGPHATESLTNHDSTPGAGTLPDGATDDVETGTG
ncbi:hypothetical protein [Segnochrobactrum spirostomi]|uniref:Uncharacterized protein n=1 Tax=Segnochrobactrum spirostomi TaxID=2608987 RepID=A0A6A7Y781_9HYPH|nr:hypothetical protein [Segnochrobactrum spirostomi]MQT13951.1 hypothetical protein [Segnochrobactrum spirostomi]